MKPFDDIENGDDDFANSLPDGIKTRKKLQRKGLLQTEPKGRLLRLNKNTFVEAPFDLKPEDEEAYIKEKLFMLNLKK